MADLNSIYNRLNAGSQYTPLSAETFGDWSLEAGDIVTVSKNGTGYQTPVMCSSLKWNGAPMVTIESEGNKERESLSKMSRRTYNSSSGGGGSGGYYRSVGGMRRIADAEEAIVLERHTREDEDKAFYQSSITVAKEYVDIESQARIKGEGNLRGEIKVEAGKISQIVEAVGADGKVTAASIVAAVNGSGSNVVISADHIQLEGAVFARKLKSALANLDGITAKIIEANSITTSGYITARGVINAYGGIQTAAGRVYNVVNVVPSGNNLVITYANGSTANFSKAIARWAVNASGGTIRVTAQPQNATKTVRVGISGPNAVYSNGTYRYKVMYENSSGDDAETGAYVDVGVSVNASHSPSASAQIGATGSVSGRTYLGSGTAASLARTYILIDVSCGGESRGYYIVLN